MCALPVVNYDPTKTIIPRKSFVVFTPTAGVNQITSATAAGTVTTAGNATITVTGAGIAGSPVVLSVAVALNDTPQQWAHKVRLAIAANVAISALYAVSYDGSANIVLTALNPAANDATLNIAIANGTSVGITAAPTSVATKAGSAAGTPVSMVAKLTTYSNKFSTVMRKVPDSSGLLRPDRIVAIEQEEDFVMEAEDVKGPLSTVFGGLNGGFVQGRVQIWIVDPSDASGFAAMKSNNFLCTCELDGGMTFDAGKVASAKLKFTSLEKVILTGDASA